MDIFDLIGPIMVGLIGDVGAVLVEHLEHKTVGKGSRKDRQKGRVLTHAFASSSMRLSSASNSSSYA